MATTEFLKESLEDFRQQRIAKLEELRSIEITINQLRTRLKQLGEAPGDEPELFTALTQGTALPTAIKPPTSHSGAGAYKPRPDEFFGMGQAEAARTYLEKIGHAVLIDDLLKAVTGGGCKVGGADPKKSLYIALVQNKRDFVPTGNNYFGLRKFYPNMPKLGRPEGAVPNKTAKRGARKSTKHNAKPKVKAVESTTHDPAKVSAAVTEVLSDHKAKSADEVIAAVERRMGHPVKKIAVYGTLRKKDFEQLEEGKYRLRQQFSEGPPVIQ
jgi:hypothetical protein